MTDPSPPSAADRPCPSCGYYVVEGAGCPRCGGSTRPAPDRPREAPGSNFFLLDIADGFLEVFRGGAYLFTRPEFEGKLKGPLLANLITIPIAVVALWLGLKGLLSWADSAGWGPAAWHVPGWLEGAFTLLLALLTIYLLLPVLVETVTAPFLDPLAEATERMLGGPGMRAERVPILRSLALSAAIGAKLLLLQIGVLVLTVLLSFCGLGLPIAILAAAYLSALVWFDIPFARRGYPLRTRRRLLAANWARAVGFGLGFQVGLLVPLFNLLLLTPAAAVAASVLFLRFDKRGA